MTTQADKWAQLREAFPPEQIGHLPKAGITLSYVGHAAVTDRLLQVDPEWTWEPFGRDEAGNPVLVENQGGMQGEPYGLWIKLTVNGVTRPGFGGGKNAKECISDAIRNAAMRFGVALDLWAKEDLSNGGASAPTGQSATGADSAAPSPSPFKQPAKLKEPDAECVTLADEILAIVKEIGEKHGTYDKLVPATAALVEKHKTDKRWLKNQLATAKTQRAKAEA